MPPEPSELKIRDPHGVTSSTSRGRIWNGIAVHSVWTRSAPGKSWQNLVSEQATVAIILEQQDGIAEPRKGLHQPMPRDRYDAGHTMYIPPNCEIWGFGDSKSLTRDLRMRFDSSMIDRLLEDELDRQKWNEPLLLLYDERIRQIASLIWQECEAEQPSPALYGESLTTALLAGLFRSECASSRSCQWGLTRSS